MFDLAQLFVQVAALDAKRDLGNFPRVILYLVVHIQVKLEHLCLPKFDHVNSDKERDWDEIGENEDVREESKNGGLASSWWPTVGSCACSSWIVASSPQVAAVLHPLGLEVLGGHDCSHSAEKKVDRKHEHGEIVTHLHDAGDLRGRFRAIHLNLGLFPGVNDDTSHPFRLPEDDSAQEHILGTKRYLLPIWAGVSSLKVEKAIVGELAHDLSAIALHEVLAADARRGHHILVGDHRLEISFSIQVGSHDLALTLRMRGFEQYHISRDRLPVANLDDISDLDVLPASINGLVIEDTTASDHVGCGCVLLVVGLVPRNVLVRLLHRSDEENEHEGHRSRWLPVGDRDGLESLENTDCQEVTVCNPRKGFVEELWEEVDGSVRRSLDAVPEDPRTSLRAMQALRALWLPRNRLFSLVRVSGVYSSQGHAVVLRRISHNLKTSRGGRGFSVTGCWEHLDVLVHG
mmetsp:Transcript_6685/g.13384  ORF Transcript_6685/g.13384 Transcript_6685/m.13384 type:complete len:461 (-) Transcript_6685:77-1459(-)